MVLHNPYFRPFRKGLWRHRDCRRVEPPDVIEAAKEGAFILDGPSRGRRRLIVFRDCDRGAQAGHYVDRLPTVDQRRLTFDLDQGFRSMRPADCRKARGTITKLFRRGLAQRLVLRLLHTEEHRLR